MRLSLPLLFLSALALPAGTQEPDSARRAPGVTISGVVRDSVSRTVLADAIVQLVSDSVAAPTARSAYSDSLGRYLFSDVPDGRYTIGFFHPMLDSLGLAPPLRAVVVAGRPARADLGIPSPARLRVAICGQAVARDGGVVIGVVRDARDGSPAAGARVVGRWLELTLEVARISGRVARAVDTTRENGFYAICNVPKQGTMTIHAGRDADSTDRIDLEILDEGFLRRDLYIGAGDAGGRMTGNVVTVSGTRPIPDAQVITLGGQQARTNASGSWVMTDAPLGTRTLEVRAIGYYPERVTVDVIAGAPPVNVALYTMRAMLDTIRITAARLSGPNMAGFEQRRQGGMGRYVTAEEILRRKPFSTSDAFRMVPGVELAQGVLLERGDSDESTPPTTLIRMRGRAEDACTPVVYVDGAYLGLLTAVELNGFVSPEEVAGIEIYRSPQIPPQFSTGTDAFTGRACGSIVIWTRPNPTLTRMSWMRRILTTGGFVAAGLLVGMLLR